MTSFIEPNMFDHIVTHSAEQFAPHVAARPVIAFASATAAGVTLKKNSKVYSA